MAQDEIQRLETSIAHHRGVAAKARLGMMVAGFGMAGSVLIALTVGFILPLSGVIIPFPFAHDLLMIFLGGVPLVWCITRFTRDNKRRAQANMEVTLLLDDIETVKTGHSALASDEAQS